MEKKRTTPMFRIDPFRLIAVGLTAALLLPYTTGCSSKNKKKTTDPLLGEFDPNGQPLPPPPAPGTQTSNNVPPFPNKTWSDSNAAIAHGPLSDTPSISIGGPNGKLTSSNWQRNVGGPNGLKLEPSRPVVEPIPSANAQPVPNVDQGNVVPARWTNPAPDVKVDPWQAQLKSRGVIDHRRKDVPGGVMVVAVLPNPQNPRFTRMVTATAANYDGAMQALLKQLDESK